MIAGKRLFGLFVSSLFLLSVLVAPAGASDRACSTPHETQPTRTFEVKVSVLEDVYQIGETAKFRVRVNRFLHGTYVGPAEGAWVRVGVSLDDVALWGSGSTDSQGRVLVKVALRSYAPPGLADVTVFASKQIVDVPCHSELEYEFGETEASDLFRVTR